MGLYLSGNREINMMMMILGATVQCEMCGARRSTDWRLQRQRRVDNVPCYHHQMTYGTASEHPLLVDNSHSPRSLQSIVLLRGGQFVTSRAFDVLQSGPLNSKLHHLHHLDLLRIRRTTCCIKRVVQKIRPPTRHKPK